MAGGGRGENAFSGLLNLGKGSVDSTSAALVAQAAQPPSSYTPPTQPSYAPITVAALQPKQAVAQQPAQMTVFNGVNPYRTTAATPSAVTAQRPTLSMPGVQGVQNPFYTQPKAPTVQLPQASALASQYQTYQQQQANQLATAAAQRRADALSAQHAYETARGNTALRNQYEGTINSLNSQIADLQSRVNQGGDGGYSWFGAEGGIAQLMKGE